MASHLNGALPADSLPVPVTDDPHLHVVRVARRGDEPAVRRGVVDVAVLDMHHGYPNLGHESIVETLIQIAREARAEMGARAPDLRVISYDVRLGLAVPLSEPSRFPLVVGTGGPGALDPRLNDGAFEGSQGVRESVAWEAPLWRFFDRILAEKRTSFLGICHSFGLLSRWAGAAEPVLRRPERGGKSMGVVTNILTPAARRHPWFSGLFRASEGPRIRVLDSRLWDLVPAGSGSAELLAFEAAGDGKEPGEAVTMLELAREEDGVAPRVWGVNHHPEIGDRGHQRECLTRLVFRGEVTREWVEERERALQAWNASASAERGLQWTSSFTFEGPLRRVVTRALAEARGPLVKGVPPAPRPVSGE